MKTLKKLLGGICKTILPIKEEVFYGNPNSSIAICTLSSIDLLRKISQPKFLQSVAVVGRLLSENKGIDALIQYVMLTQKLKQLFFVERRFGDINLGIRYLNYTKMELMKTII